MMESFEKWIAFFLIVLYVIKMYWKSTSLVGKSCDAISHVPFFVHQVLGIVKSHVEIKYIFSVMGIITNLKCFRLGIDNLDQFIVIIKNWPIDTRVEFKLNFKHLKEVWLKLINKCFRKHDMFKDDSSFDFMWPWLRF